MHYDSAACLLFWEAQVPLAQVKQNGLVGFGKPAVHFVLGEAGAQSSQVACHGLVQAGQHQGAKQFVLHFPGTLQSWDTAEQHSCQQLQTQLACLQ